MKFGMTRWKMVPSYKGVCSLVAPLTGFFHCLVPVARPMKFLTVSGALSGYRVQVILPRLVSKRALGRFGAAAVVACVAGLAGVLAAGLAAGLDVCPKANVEI